VLLGVGLALFASMIAAVYAWGKTPLPAVPASSTIHAVAMLVIASTTAALLLTHARASGERGYLILGGTFAYVAGVMVLFPTVYPNGIVATDPPNVLWGTLQSSATLFHPWHLALIIGVTVSALVLARDQRNGRPLGLGRGITWTVLAVASALVLTTVAVVPLIDVFPAVVDGIEATSAALFGFRVEALLALVGTIVVAYECRDGSMISRWLLAVMVVTLGEAITMLNADRYSLAWYYNRVIGLAAALILLIVLIRDLGRVERTTKQLLDRDALTRAWSRPAMLAALDRELRRARFESSTVVVLWVDIDGFKEINERVGQAVGDRILVETCARLTDECGPEAVVARMGGDEFAVILPESGARQADEKVSRILERMRHPFHVLDASVVLTASSGVADSPEGMVDADTLVRRSSLAMLAAKSAGGDRSEWFADALGSDAVQRAQLRHLLTQGIRDHQFTLEYQPIVDLETGEVAGAEALVGWLVGGTRESAGRFVPFAEESGLIVGIGRQVVAALEVDALTILESVPPPFVLTFNLSVKELADAEISEQLVHGPLHRYASRMIVEVTESFEMRAGSRAAANLERLRDAGYSVAIDDFGAGFSNFVRLSQLRPAIVKIDRSIVVRAGAGSVDGVATLRATTEVARSLRSRVLAEGVETNDEAEACIRLGIDLAQGYRYSRSVGVDGLLAFWAARAVDASVPDLGKLSWSDRDAGPT
jgi:diguanylate cyclase (GGDEF)-like protein